MFLLHTNPYLHNVTLEEKHIIMCAYTIYLALGNNLVCRSIKSDTISHYISAIGEHFVDHGFVKGRAVSVYNSGKGFIIKIHDQLGFKFRCSHYNGDDISTISTISVTFEIQCV